MNLTAFDKNLSLILFSHPGAESSTGMFLVLSGGIYRLMCWQLTFPTFPDPCGMREILLSCIKEKSRFMKRKCDTPEPVTFLWEQKNLDKNQISMEIAVGYSSLSTFPYRRDNQNE
ncbi:hypothetical protein [Gimesia sp.]|uniref:hypothetical protein n=1 Tax=Gimesia sp. TaxID=2024833 RepID=UPI003A8F3251